MKQFLEGEAYYLRKDSLFKGLCVLFLLGSIALLLLIATRVGIEADRPLKTLVTAVSFSPFFYFIIPIQACFFSRRVLNMAP